MLLCFSLGVSSGRSESAIARRPGALLLSSVSSLCFLFSTLLLLRPIVVGGGRLRVAGILFHLVSSSPFLRLLRRPNGTCVDSSPFLLLSGGGGGEFYCRSSLLACWLVIGSAAFGPFLSLVLDASCDRCWLLRAIVVTGPEPSVFLYDRCWWRLRQPAFDPPFPSLLSSPSLCDTEPYRCCYCVRSLLLLLLNSFV